MTSAKPSGMRMGTGNSSSLNLLVSEQLFQPQHLLPVTLTDMLRRGCAPDDEREALRDADGVLEHQLVELAGDRAELKSAMPLPRLSAQIFSSAGTIGRMSVPGARKPCARAPGVSCMRACVHSPEQQPGALDAEPAHMGAHMHA